MSFWTGGRYGYSGISGGGIPSHKLVEKEVEVNPQKLLRNELHEIANTQGISKMVEALGNLKGISNERKLEFLKDYLLNHQIY
jgi:hypothetical protein